MPRRSTLTEARAAKEVAMQRLAGNGEVVAIGVTKANGGYAVKVLLKESPTGSIPAEIDGVPLVVDTVGVVRKRSG